MAYAIVREYRYPVTFSKVLHVFKDKDKAINYIVDYLYNNSTMEDRQTKVEINEFDHYTEYSLYTCEHGLITVRLEETYYN